MRPGIKDAAVSGGAYLYILHCADGSYYTGTARQGLERRVAEHNAGIGGAFTAQRCPVKLVFAEHFPRITDAIEMERRIKGWSRAKKEALVSGNWDGVQMVARRRGPHPSRRASRSSG
jgi:putative endonuclease